MTPAKLAVALAAALPLAFAGVTATAQAEVLVRDEVSGGPWLAGDAVGWLAENAFLRTQREGAAATDLGRVQAIREDDQDAGYDTGTRVAFAAGSSSRYAVVEEGFDVAKSKVSGNGTVDQEAVILDGAGRRSLRTCGEDGGLDLDLDGPRLVLTRCGGTGVDLFDLGRPGDPPRELSATGTDPRVAGDLAAWREPEAFVVFDLAGGRELFRAPTAGPASVLGYDLQADGKIVVASTSKAYGGRVPPYGSTEGEALAWTGPGRPGFTPVDPGGPFAAMRIAGDRIALHRTGDPDEAVILDLSGRVLSSTSFVDPRTLNSYVRGTYARPSVVDFDGRRLALVADVCGGPALAAFDPAAGAVPSVERCPLLLFDESLRIRKRRTKVSVGCPTLLPARANDPCQVTLTLRAGGRRIGRVRKTLAAGSRRELTVRVAARAARRLQRNDTRKVSVQVRNRMRGGAESSSARLKLRVSR